MYFLFLTMVTPSIKCHQAEKWTFNVPFALSLMLLFTSIIVTSINWWASRFFSNGNPIIGFFSSKKQSSCFSSTLFTAPITLRQVNLVPKTSPSSTVMLFYISEMCNSHREEDNYWKLCCGRHSPAVHCCFGVRAGLSRPCCKTVTKYIDDENRKISSRR